MRNEIALVHDNIGVIARASKLPQGNGLFTVVYSVAWNRPRTSCNLLEADADHLIQSFIDRAKKAMIPA